MKVKEKRRNIAKQNLAVLQNVHTLIRKVYALRSKLSEWHKKGDMKIKGPREGQVSPGVERVCVSKVVM